jgi:type IV pilus assembly protein PilQ
MLFFTTAPLAQDLEDIRFYNLEKEYRTTVTWIYTVKNTGALELKPIVADMLSIHGSLYVNGETNELYITDVPEKVDDLKSVLPRLDSEKLVAGNNLVSRVIYLRHENAAVLSDIIRHKLSEDGALFEVPYLNALTITDIPSKIAQVEALLEKLDVPGPHIAIDITIVEFNDERFSQLGVNMFDWLQGLSIRGDFHGANPGDLKNHSSLMLRSRNRPPLTERGFTSAPNDRPTEMRLSAELNVSDIVRFICDFADGSVLANTRIVTRNNKQARISAQEVIPYRLQEAEPAYQLLTEYAQPAVPGIEVLVLPTLQEDSLVNLRIHPTIADLTGWSPKGQPIVFRRSLSTEVKVRDASVFVLGGLRKRESVNQRRGIPFLKDIPGLGLLFSIRKKITLEREVLIFIQPSTQAVAELSATQVRQTLQRYRDSVGDTRFESLQVDSAEMAQ